MTNNNEPFMQVLSCAALLSKSLTARIRPSASSSQNPFVNSDKNACNMVIGVPDFRYDLSRTFPIALYNSGLNS